MEAATRSTSRFASGTNEHGLAVDASIQPLGFYEQLLTERDSEGEPLVQPVEVRLKRVASVVDGALALVDIAEPVAFVPSVKSVISGKFRKRGLRGWAFLDEFFAGGDVWREARDEDVWSAALEAAEDARYGAERDTVRGDSGTTFPTLTRGLWFLNRVVALALVHRRGGVHVRVSDLPTV